MFRSEGGFEEGNSFDVACGWHYYYSSEKQANSSSGAQNTSTCCFLMLERDLVPRDPSLAKGSMIRHSFLSYINI